MFWIKETAAAHSWANNT